MLFYVSPSIWRFVSLNFLYNFLVCDCLIPTVLIRGTTWITLSKLGNASIIEAIVIRNQHFLPGLFIDIKWINFWWAADYFFVFIVSCFFYSFFIFLLFRYKDLVQLGVLYITPIVAGFVFWNITWIKMLAKTILFSFWNKCYLNHVRRFKLSYDHYTAWKVSVFGVHLVRIFRAFGLKRETRNTFPYSVRRRENTDQKNSKYGHFSRSVIAILDS